ncbi:hypothetical protein LINGRAHAP2_LOCUS15252 [Linum grandiflorum]
MENMERATHTCLVNSLVEGRRKVMPRNARER